MNEIIDAINLLSTDPWSYLITNIPLGYKIFFNWFNINKYRIWILKILMPQVVDPAQPPMNIKPKNIISVKLPHVSKSSFTYPVPVKIEIILNNTDLSLSSVEPLIIKYRDNIIILKIIILKKLLIWTSLKIILLSPLMNLMYAINGKLPKIIKIIAEISIDTLSKKPMDSL